VLGKVGPSPSVRVENEASSSTGKSRNKVGSLYWQCTECSYVILGVTPA
jgi:hypothetical protein